MNASTIVRNPYAKKKSVENGINNVGNNHQNGVVAAPLGTVERWRPAPKNDVANDGPSHSAVAASMQLAIKPSIPSASASATKHQGLNHVSGNRTEIENGDNTETTRATNGKILTTAPFSTTVAAEAQPKTALHHSSTTSSNDIPLWQRLPSEAITFTSAEILTVTEVHERFQNQTSAAVTTNVNDDDDGYPLENSSIRVTGIVWHRYIHADASVSIVLRDPLTSLDAAAVVTPSSGRQLGRPSTTSILKRPRLSAGTSIATAIMPRGNPETPAAAISSTTAATSTMSRNAPSRVSFPHATINRSDSAGVTNIGATKTPSYDSGRATTLSVPPPPPATTTGTAATATTTASRSGTSRNGLQSSILLNNKNKTFLYKKPASSGGRRLSFANTVTTVTTVKRQPPNLLSSTNGLVKRRFQSISSSAATTNPKVESDPLDAMVQAIVGSVPCVWVVVTASNQHVLSTMSTGSVAGATSTCVENDLAMVMGEVLASNILVHDDGAAINGTETASRPAHHLLQEVTPSGSTTGSTTCDAVADVLQKLKGLPQQHEDSASDERARKRCYCLKARILRNVNGTDMRLYANALVARRSFLQSQRRQQQQHQHQSPATSFNGDRAAAGANIL